MTQEEVIDLMKSSKNSQEWNANCDTVKKAHDNNYPNYWYPEIILSGLCDKTLGEGSSKITFSTGTIDELLNIKH
jgi:hypothetical protein